MKLLSKFFSLLMIWTMMSSPVLANYAAFQTAEEAFRAHPNHPEVAQRMLELAKRGVLPTTGYVDYYASLPEEKGGLSPADKAAWLALPQAKYAQMPLLRVFFDTSRVLMSFLGTLENNSPLRISPKKLIPTLKDLGSHNMGQTYFWMHQFATQETILGKPNSFKEEALQAFLRPLGLPSSILLAEAFRLGAIAEVYPIWDTAFSFADVPPFFQTFSPVQQARRLKIWLDLKLLRDPNYLSSPALYDDIVREKALGVQSFQFLTASSLFGNTAHQILLYQQLQESLQDLQAQEEDCTKQIDTLTTQQRPLQVSAAKQRARLSGPQLTRPPINGSPVILVPDGQYIRGTTERSKELINIFHYREFLCQQREAIRAPLTKQAALFAFWHDILLLKNAPPALSHTGEDLWAQGKHTESRPYFERIVAQVPETREAAIAHARLAALAAEEGQEADILPHAQAARALFQNARLFPPQDRPSLYYENELLAADEWVRQDTLEEAETIWDALLDSAQEELFHTSGRPLQLALCLLFKGHALRDETVLQRAVTLLEQHVFPQRPSALESLLLRTINYMLLRIQNTVPHLFEDHLTLLPELIAYGVRHNPLELEHHLNAMDYYNRRAGTEDLYHHHALAYFRLRTGLSLKDLWNMPSHEFRAYLQERVGADPMVLKECLSILNDLGYAYWEHRIPNVSNAQQDRRAVALFKKAAYLHDPLAMRNLALAYQKGVGGLRASTANAIGCLEIAKKFAPQDADILRKLGLFYKVLYDTAHTPENKRLFSEKAVSNLEDLGEALSVTDRVNLGSLRVLQARDADEHLDTLSSERYEERAEMVQQLLKIVEEGWSGSDPIITDEFLVIGHTIQLALYWDTPPESAHEWSKRLRSAVKLAHKTRGFDLLKALQAHLENPFLQNQKSPEEEAAADAESAPQPLEERVEADGEVDADAPTGTGEEADVDLYEGEEDEVAPETLEVADIAGAARGGGGDVEPMVARPILTKSLLKKFTGLFRGKMNKADIDKLIQEFDAENGTRFWEWYGRKSHQVHGRDTFRGHRNRSLSAIKLFDKYAGITLELVEEQLTPLTR